jgi:hypothetical protein
MITTSIYEGKEYKIEIAGDYCYCDTDSGTVAIPQPTLGFIFAYQDRLSYFRDPDLGLGRVLVTLSRQLEDRGKFISNIRKGGDIPDDEARAAQEGTHPDRNVYYAMIHRAINYGAEECERKMKLLFAKERGHAN